MSIMKLFSWFIKASSNSKAKRETLATSKSEALETKLTDKSNAFNNNTMWPIAKVKTTTIVINEPVTEENTKQSEDETISQQEDEVSLDNIPLGQ